MLETLIANKSGKIRRAKLHGRSYFVAPMVMLTEGVHEGSDGTLYYPSKELAKLPSGWNHKPVTIGHPSINGESVSACSVEALERFAVGIILNSEYDALSKKLRADAYLDEQRLRAVSPKAFTVISAGRLVEVSTGLFTRNSYYNGTFNGTDYDAVARDYVPDHLAILIGQRGACSINSGCGLNTNSKKRVSKAMCRDRDDDESEASEQGSLLPPTFNVNAYRKSKGLPPLNLNRLDPSSFGAGLVDDDDDDDEADDDRSYSSTESGSLIPPTFNAEKWRKQYQR